MESITTSNTNKPANLNEAVLTVSPTFKKKVFRVLFSILFFITIYAVLVAIAFLMAVLCGYGGIMLILFLPKLITLVIGLGLAGVGLMVVFFLFKFLGKKMVVDHSNFIEIKEAEQPELFSFVRELTHQIQTPFPRKIVLSAEVNASVFYNSTFWSMLFPVKKNLHIGLGLVNCVDVSEFRAILAHEFGHFSQRSMKLGSYVYNVNHVIHNLLYENDSYGETIQKWANINGYFAFFASITIHIVKAIQWLLQRVYSVVNLSYMSLSREMEFHADTVSAYVSGSMPLITSLRRLDLSGAAYNNLMNYYDMWCRDGLKSDNMFPQHREVMNQLAIAHKLPFENGLPQVGANAFARYNKARVGVKDQWASHPTTDDREAHLRSLNIQADQDHRSAWSIFKNPDELQKKVTDLMYKNVTFKKEPSILDASLFKLKYEEEINRYKLDDRYNEFFNFRKISEIDLADLEKKAPTDVYSLEQLFSEKTVTLPNVMEGLNSDIATLDAICKGDLKVRTFDFNGQKYRKSDCAQLLSQLRNEFTEAEKKLIESDRQIIAFFLQKAQQHGKLEDLRATYSEFFTIAKLTDEDAMKYNHLMQDMRPLYMGSLSVEMVTHLMSKIKLHEAHIRERLRVFITGEEYNRFMKEEEKQRVEQYLASEHVYFTGTSFNNDALTLLADAANSFYDVTVGYALSKKKNLLDWQLTFLN